MTPYLELSNLPSAWKGHEYFAMWLVKQVQPQISVDLGVDYGYSLFSLAIPGIGEVYGIDSFEGDIHTGHHSDSYNVVMNFKNRHFFNKVHIIKGWFDEVVKSWNHPIDILHIDGLHTYDAVKNDWDNWHQFVTNSGVTIMHDVISFQDVGRFYNEIQLPKAYFAHSSGLGVVSHDREILLKISENFPNIHLGNI